MAKGFDDWRLPITPEMLDLSFGPLLATVEPPLGDATEQGPILQRERKGLGSSTDPWWKADGEWGILGRFPLFEETVSLLPCFLDENRVVALGSNACRPPSQSSCCQNMLAAWVH